MCTRLAGVQLLCELYAFMRQAHLHAAIGCAESHLASTVSAYTWREGLQSACRSAMRRLRMWFGFSYTFGRPRQ